MNINRLGNKLHMDSQFNTQKEKKMKGNIFGNHFEKNLLLSKQDSFDKSAVCVSDTYWGNYEYYGVQTINRIKESGHIEKSAVAETEVRYISYEESHHVQINMKEGYTYRAKVEMSSYSVYVEYRDEEGMAKAYVTDIPSVSKDTENPVEQMALAAWNKVLEENRRQLGLTEYARPEEAVGKKVELEHRLQSKVPYEYLADDSGNIIYNGVTFVCDREKNAICLGDMSNPDNVLTIPLERGGSLKVNRDNFEDLARAITMFSPEDRNRIMRAIQQDKKVQQMKQEIEDDKNSVGEIL